MKDLSLHILDICENSIKSGATKINVKIKEEGDKLILIVEDNGMGMDEKMIKDALSPFFSTKGTSRYGLGLPLLKQSCEATGGELVIKSEIGKGTIVEAHFFKNHIDMKPLGDINSTLINLQKANPKIEFSFEYYI